MREQTDINGAWNKERKRINRTALISVVLAAVMIVTFFAGYFVRGMTEASSTRKINELLGIIQNTSVYAGDKTEDELAADLIKEILKDDKYARYYSPKEYEKVLEEDKGRYSGVGIGLVEVQAGDEKVVKIAKVYLNSSAYKKGVKEGDRLIAGRFKGETYEDENDYTDFAAKAKEDNSENNIFKKSSDDGVSVLSVINDFFAGFDIGDELDIKVMRDGETEPIKFTVKKENYTVSYVEYKDNEKYYYFSTDTDGFKGREDDYSDYPDKALPVVIDHDTAYIKLYEFEGSAAAQFAEALEYMRTRGKTRLILDLRDNGGGLIDVLLEIASYIINDNDASNIKILNFKDTLSESHYSAANRFYKGAYRLTDISVIANAGTASASECLIGALIDYGNKEQYGGAQFGYDRLVLTPKKDANGNDVYRTYGKGIMQTTYPLKSGGALVLTTAYISWPVSRRCVQGEGVTSDVNATDENAIARANAVLH